MITQWEHYTLVEDVRPGQTLVWIDASFKDRYDALAEGAYDAYSDALSNIMK